MDILNTVSLEIKINYHPLFVYDGLTGDLIKVQLRNGTKYCSKDADVFMESLLEEFIKDFPDIPLYLRGDSGFASPDLYEVLEEKGCKYFCIRPVPGATPTGLSSK